MPKIDDADLSRALAQLCEELLNGIAAEVGDTLPLATTVWIVDDDQFGVTIEEVAPGTEYTKNEFFVAVAKTIRQTNHGGIISNSIILNFGSVILPVLNYIADSDRHSDPDATYLYELSRSILFHEFGHCKDNLLRPELVTLPPISTTWFKIENSVRYHIPILAEEYAACVHAAIGVTKELLDREFKSLHETVQQFMDELEGIRRQPVGNIEKSLLFGEKPVAAMWAILIQCAKLAGTMHGNSNLQPSINPWPDANDLATRVIAEFFDNLREAWTRYPNWTYETFTFATEAWFQLGFAQGFLFEYSSPSDRISWRID